MLRRERLDLHSGVIDANHQGFSYRGLHVCDGLAIPADLGVNPSLTIPTLAERAIARVMPKDAMAAEEGA